MITLPTSTQVPHWVFDLAPSLEERALRCLLVMCRERFGVDGLRQMTPSEVFDRVSGGDRTTYDPIDMARGLSDLVAEGVVVQRGEYFALNVEDEQ